MFGVQKLFDFETLVQEAAEGVDVDAAWPSKGQIEFKAVRLRYRPQTETVLDGLTFNVLPGMKVGVVGRTGAGKSTLALALSRLVELEEGIITIDGVDISKVNLSTLR
jgi:ATP-binding cassette subfamily C (CFTR/MRP) protein 1